MLLEEKIEGKKYSLEKLKDYQNWIRNIVNTYIWALDNP